MPSAPGAHRLGDVARRRCRRSRPAAAWSACATAASPSAPTGRAGIGLGRGRRERPVGDVVDDGGVDRAQVCPPPRARRRGSHPARASRAPPRPADRSGRRGSRRRTAVTATSTRSLTISGTPSGSSTALSARAVSSRARPPALLVAQLHQSDAAPDRRGHHVDQRPAARQLRIGHEVEGRIEAAGHAILTPRSPSSRRAAPARSTIRQRRLPGPADSAAARSPARPNTARPCAAASSGSRLDRQEGADHRARGAAERGHPGHARIAVASPPRQRSPSVMRSIAPVTATTAPDACASCCCRVRPPRRRRACCRRPWSVRAAAPASARISEALPRITVGPQLDQLERGARAIRRGAGADRVEHPGATQRPRPRRRAAPSPPPMAATGCRC